MRACIADAVAQGARLAAVCERVGISERTVQRWETSPEDARHGPNTVPANKLSDLERELVLSMANSEEFRDVSPKQMVPRLADRGVYLASESTIYRALHAESLMAHRGRAKAPVPRPRPELVARGPNQVWTWDITYLRSPIRGAYFYLYLVVDIFSRRVVGWEVHDEESSVHSAALIQRLFVEAGSPKGLKLHSDNGGPMKGSTMLAMIQSLGMSASFSRPRVSDDNPYSEALFRTVKYCALFPEKPFESLATARAWVAGFVGWYNTKHLHSALRFVTPDQRHQGLDVAMLAKRTAVYTRARRQNPRRWTQHIRNWSPAPAVRLGPERMTSSPQECSIH